MHSDWLARDSTPDVAVYVVWSPQLGAEERHVPDATRLIPDSRVRHYWDPKMRVGGAYQDELDVSEPAWDVWMLFARNATWNEAPPSPSWWEHQLAGLPDSLHLDVERFARKARELVESDGEHVDRLSPHEVALGGSIHATGPGAGSTLRSCSASDSGSRHRTGCSSHSR